MTHSTGEDAVPRRASPGSRARHTTAFALCGALATGVDLGLFAALHHGAGQAPAVARVAAIAAAVLVGWAAHRTYTFRVAAPPTVREFLRYAGVAWLSILTNYAVFVSALALAPSVPPMLLIVVASGTAMVVSYLGMRIAVFRGKADT